jgi:preprotein translocase subunit SecF
MELLKNPNFDFLGRARWGFLLSGTLVAAGIYMVASGHIRYGVEFQGGTQLIVQFQKTPAVDKIRDAVAKASEGAVIQTFGNIRDNKVLIRLGLHEGESDIDAVAQSALHALAQSYPDNPVIESSSEIVGPTVGAELRQKAILLTTLGLLFQLVYIGARFKGGVCLGFLAFFDYEITLNVIAALLTLVGYSVNDTIVIFDRARENLRQRRKDPFTKLLNDSINQTLTRTLISSGTTFLAVLALYLFGGEVLRGFAFTLVVGITVGTYSTMFIAVPIVDWWYARMSRHASPAAKAAL